MTRASRQDGSLAEVVESGRRAAQQFQDGDVATGAAALGSFSGGARFAALVLRRTLLRLRMPTSVIELVRPLAARLDRSAALDRFARDYAFWAGVKGAAPTAGFWRGLARGPVILMYHAVGSPNEPASCYVVPARRFRMQMAWLRWRRYNVIGLQELTEHLRLRRIVPPRSVVITFDDGFADNCEHALPSLEQYRFPATVFLVSAAVGGTAWWPTDAALIGRPMLSERQVWALLAAGVSLGAHTRTHPALTALAPDEQLREIGGAKDDLEERFRVPVRSFAYPFGDRSPTVVDTVRRAGFEVACCSRSGVNDPATSPLELRRLEVRGTDTLLDFAFMLWRAHRPARRASGAPQRVVA